MKKTKHIIIGISIVIAILILVLLAFDKRLIIRKYTLQSPKILTPLRIALLTDLHGCDYGSGQLGLVTAIDKAAPDLILLGGDIFDDVLSFQKSEELLQAIEGRYPTYYVSGNHEYWSYRIDEIHSILRSYGVTVLDGQILRLNFDGQRIDLAGISDPDIVNYTKAIVSSEQQLEQLSAQIQEPIYSILLAHRPERFSDYTEAGFDLALSGHAHGGQWRIPGLLNGLYAPNQGLFPKLAGGKYRSGKTTLIVSRGLARESTRLPRIFNRPELVIVDLLLTNK